MKRSKLLIVIVTAFFLTILTSCMSGDGSHTHSYGEWTFTTEPTLEEKGEATKECECGKELTVPVASLSDRNVWRPVPSEHIDPTCTKVGSETLRSIYGEFRIEIPMSEHEYGAWKLTKAPTETEVGSAERTCHCGHVSTGEVPVVTDEIWEEISRVDADYNKEGKKELTSEYGTVEVALPKLVAPYDGKTYSNVAFDASNDEEGFKYGEVSTIVSWNAATITIDETGKGMGTAFPFRGLNQLSMVDASTGLMKMVVTPYSTDEEGNVTFDVTNKTEYVAYVDFATGIIIRPFNSKFNYVVLYTPFELNAEADCAVSSAWEDSMAISYTYNETTYNIFIYDSVVYFGVTFESETGSSITADKCYNAPYLYVKNSEGKLIKGFAFDGEKEVVVDGYEATYTSGEETIVISGFGTATYGGKTGTYKFVEGKEYTADLYVDNVYYELTLNKETKAFSIHKPMVQITYVAGEYAEVENATVNKNIKYTLPVLDNPTHTFKGWYTDEACTKEVEEEFVPTVDITLYAKWVAKVKVNLVGVLADDANVVYLGIGDTIGNALPEYNIDQVKRQKFVGWYYESTFETSVPLEAIMNEEDTDITLYAKWEALPAYYGTYNGTEIWGVTSGNNANATFTIDENGKISGKYTGVVVSYDKETQKITWKEKESDTKTYGLWFDEASGVMATHYSSKTEIGTDYYIYSMYQTTNKVSAHYGFTCKKIGTSISNTYARLVTLQTKSGLQTIFVYCDRIYSNIIISDTTGKVFTGDKLIEDVKKSKTLVVRDAETKEMILGLAAAGDNFTANTKTVELDPYFGTYTCGEASVVLDGVGTITYNGKTGTYTKSAEGSSFGFDVYLDDNKEYYQLTLNGNEAVMNKPTVTITFVVGEGHTAVESLTVNMNIVATLPEALEENYVFNGWFYDQEFKNAVGETIVPTQNTTLYGKHSNPAKLTIVYNNTEDNDVVVYSVGDVATVERPVYAKHAFVGWYTTEAFEEGTEWASGTVINVDTTIYAKWEDAPIYNDTYLAIRFDGNSKNGGTSSAYINKGTSTTKGAVLAIDPYGKAENSSYPFSGSAGIVIEDYNEETGILYIKVGSTKYRSYIDKETGFIFMNRSSGNVDLGEGFFLVKDLDAKADQFSCSYWNGGKTKVLEYTTETKTYRYFITNDTVYSNVKYTDIEGNAIVGEKCFESSAVLILDKDNKLIAKYGFDGTTMVELDGNEGVFTNGESSAVIDGIEGIKIDGVDGKYVELEKENTLGVYNENGYFEVTLDKVNKTYTIVKPMVTVQFSAGHGVVVDEESLNINIEVTLPTPTATGFKFRGWYEDEALTKATGEKYTPTKNITLYAKWDEEVVLTVVYGNTLENATLTYGKGDKVAPVEPEYTNGLVFDGWYTDAEYTEKYTVGVITESMTIYCKWMEATPLYGTYVGFEAWSNIWITNNKNFTVDPVGKTTGVVSNGTVSEYDETNNTFKVLYGTSGSYYYGCYDSENGICAINYSAKTNSLGTDHYILFKGYTKITGDKDNSVGLDSNKYHLITVDCVKNGVESTMIVFVAPNAVYGNVTYTGAANVKAAATAEELKIYDCHNNLIATFNKGVLAK